MLTPHLSLLPVEMAAGRLVVCAGHHTLMSDSTWAGGAKRVATRIFHLWLGLGTIFAAACNTELRWKEIHAVGPSERWGARALLDARRDRVLLFGGSGAQKLGDLWSFNLETERWEQVPFDSGPSARDTGAFLVDPSGQRALYYGGRGGPAALSEIWALDLASLTWTRLVDGAPGRFEFGIATHEGLAWFYGGNLQGDIENNELWEMDLAQATMRQLPAGQMRPHPSTSPALMFRDGAIYLTGGHDNSGHVGFGTWRYVLAASSWEELQPRGQLAAEAHMGYGFDDACDRLLLHGGDNANGMDVTTLVQFRPGPLELTQLPAKESPPPRRHHVAIWDGSRRNLFLFGGWSGADVLYRDTWTLNLPSCP
jgi:hypothetical protein